MSLALGEGAEDGEARLAAAGLVISSEGQRVFIDRLVFGTPAAQLREDFGVDFDWEILQVETVAPRPPKQLVYVPALLLLGLVGFSQLRRRRSEVYV